MNAESAIKSTQEQAVASWITYINQIRITIFHEKLRQQDTNLENALIVLEELKKSIAEEVIDRNRGGDKGIHGFIGERMQVYIENAKNLVDGLEKEYLLIDDNGPVDYFKNGVPIQQKARQYHLGIDAIKEHFEKYPDFLENGGKYEIPKDYYEKLQKLWNLTAEEAKKIKNSENGDYRLWKAIQAWKEQNKISLDQIAPMDAKYSEIQKATYKDTIDKREIEIKKKDKINRDKAYQASKPTLQQGMQATLLSAGMEGGTAFLLGVVKKRKAGKKLSEFTVEDWKELGICTGYETVKGGIRGSSVYVLSNFTITPAPVASALVTAIFGVLSQAEALRKKAISKEEFIIRSEAVCFEVSISAISSLMGQTMIPIPVLGALIGNTAGIFLYQITQLYCSKAEQQCISSYQADLERLNQEWKRHYLDLVKQLKEEFCRFRSVVDLAFDKDINISFAGSIALARMTGVQEEQILKNKEEIDRFFLE